MCFEEGKITVKMWLWESGFFISALFVEQGTKSKTSLPTIYLSCNIIQLKKPVLYAMQTESLMRND